MNHQVAMRIGYRLADLLEKPAAFAHAEAALLAVLLDGPALHELHDEPRAAIGGSSAVEQTGDVGVIERGQDAALMAETLEHRIGVHSPLHHFDGYAFFERAIGAHGGVDGAHASTANLFHHFPRAQPPSGHRFALQQRGGAVLH